MLLASIFMYMVLAAQFESFSYPFIIMLTLPLSVPFALFSLWITGRALSLWSALGMFLLLGDREEERHPAGGLHQSAAWRRECRCAKPFWRPIACGCARF